MNSLRVWGIGIAAGTLVVFDQIFTSGKINREIAEMALTLANRLVG